MKHDRTGTKKHRNDRNGVTVKRKQNLQFLHAFYLLVRPTMRKESPREYERDQNPFSRCWQPLVTLEGTGAVFENARPRRRFEQPDLARHGFFTADASHARIASERRREMQVMIVVAVRQHCFQMLTLLFPDAGFGPDRTNGMQGSHRHSGVCLAYATPLPPLVSSAQLPPTSTPVHEPSRQQSLYLSLSPPATTYVRLLWA